MISNNKEGGKSKSFFYPEIFGRAQHDQHDRWLRHCIYIYIYIYIYILYDDSILYMTKYFENSEIEHHGLSTIAPVLRGVLYDNLRTRVNACIIVKVNLCRCLNSYEDKGSFDKSN